MYRKVLPFVAVDTLAAGLFLHCVGLLTNAWFSVEYQDLEFTGSLGLWKACIEYDCLPYDDFSIGGAGDWLVTCQGLAIFGLVAGLIAFLASCLIIAFNAMGRLQPKINGPVALTCSLLSLVTILACSFRFSLKANDELGEQFNYYRIKPGYSLVLSNVGGALVLLGGAVTVFIRNIVIADANSSPDGGQFVTAIDRDYLLAMIVQHIKYLSSLSLVFGTISVLYFIKKEFVITPR